MMDFVGSKVSELAVSHIENLFSLLIRCGGIDPGTYSEENRAATT